MAVVDETLTVKGQPVKSLLKFIDKELTAEQKEAALLTAPPEYVDRFRRANILVSETVPVAVLNRLTEAAAIAKGEPVERFANRAGRVAAEEAISGVYRLFAMVMTPTAILSKASRIWSSLYSRGNLHVESETSRGARVKLLDFPTEPVGCARITGWMERLTELTNAKNGKVRQVGCFSKGAQACEWEIEWE